MSADGSLLSMSIGHDRRQAAPERVPQGRPRGRQGGADCPVRFRPGHPRGLRIHARWPVPVRQLLLHRRFQHLPLRARDRRTRSGQQRGDRLLPPDPDGGRHADRPGIHRGGFAPTIIDPKPLEDVSAITFLGAQIASKHPIVKEWAVGPPASRGPRVDDHAPRQVPADARARLWRRLSHRRGLQDSVALGWHVRFADPAQFHRLDISASYSVDDELPSKEKPHVNLRYETPVWRWEYWHNGADFYDLFGPTKRSRKGDAFLGEYKKGAHLRRSAPGWTCRSPPPISPGSTRCRSTRTCRPASARSFRARPSSTTPTRAARRAPWITRKAIAGSSPANVDQAGGDTRVQVPRRLRFRFRASARKLVRVALQLGRRRQRQPRQQPRELLLRRIRQQLCR